MAERIVDAYIVVSEPAQPYVLEECPVCGFDSLLTFPCALLTSHGVAPGGEIKACARCADVDDEETAS